MSVGPSLPVSCCLGRNLALFEGVEEISAALAAWIQRAVDTHAVQLLETSAVEFQDFEAWGDVPDVNEGDLSELAAPLSGNADAAAEGHDHVTQVLAAVEAFVGVGPHAVDGVGTLGLSEDILESDLQVVVDVVWITVDEIKFGHFVL